MLIGKGETSCPRRGTAMKNPAATRQRPWEQQVAEDKGVCRSGWGAPRPGAVYPKEAQAAMGGALPWQGQPAATTANNHSIPAPGYLGDSQRVKLALWPLSSDFRELCGFSPRQLKQPVDSLQFIGIRHTPMCVFH